MLYAPTWRDDLATNSAPLPWSTTSTWRRPRRRSGDGLRLLLRGHRFHPGGAREGTGPRLIDVTTYPEINDLILASDVAVLDYSSLRFDFALTKRPMVFLVPDLDEYTGGVRASSTRSRTRRPARWSTTADEVVDQLRDLDGVRREHAEETALQRTLQLPAGRTVGGEGVVRTFFS